MTDIPSRPSPDDAQTGEAFVEEVASGVNTPSNPTMEEVAGKFGSSVVLNDDGGLDVLATVGGVRGLAETILPSAVFLVLFIITTDLVTAGAWALGVSTVFTLIRLIQRQTILQSVSGLLGVALCVGVALFSDEARQYYVIGFYTNIAYLAAMLLSMVARWPLMGLLFGFIRGEGIEWRTDKSRRAKYQVATAFLAAMFAVRLIVQLPLYWADQVGALGTARLVMGVPLYAMALWLAWLVSRPVEKTVTGATA